jgi:hypothetical protein
MTVYTYGMRLRGFSIGAQPTRGILFADDDPAHKYHSILTYSQPLSVKDCEDYELDYLGEREL